MYLKLVAATLCLCGLFAAGTASADPTYMVAQIGIQDKEAFFGKYGAATRPILERTKAKILVATPTVTKLEGEWLGNWTVVLEFPSAEDAAAWWDSTDYQEGARPHRLQSTSFGNMILAPGFAGFGDTMKK